MSLDKTLLIIAHGSRATSANEEFLQLVQQLKPRFHQYRDVRGVFLELCAPSLADAVNELADAGHNEFDVYPMFFNCGKHVKQDIPGIVETLRSSHPTLEIRLLDYFGCSEQLGAAMLNHVEQQITHADTCNDQL